MEIVRLLFDDLGSRGLFDDFGEFLQAKSRSGRFAPTRVGRNVRVIRMNSVDLDGCPDRWASARRNETEPEGLKKRSKP